MNIPFWIAAAILVLIIISALDLVRGNRSVRALREVSPYPAPGLPRVSIIVAARNEQRNIREALQSLLDLGYPDYELIVVDDRSEDATGRILDDMATGNCRLRIIHVYDLPPGWLGKNHALWVGSRRATGELLLFSDADIVMESTVVTRAVAFLQQNRLDHLAATPSMSMPNTFLVVRFINIFTNNTVFAMIVSNHMRRRSWHEKLCGLHWCSPMKAENYLPSFQAL